MNDFCYEYISDGIIAAMHKRMFSASDVVLKFDTDLLLDTLITLGYYPYGISDVNDVDSYQQYTFYGDMVYSLNDAEYTIVTARHATRLIEIIL